MGKPNTAREPWARSYYTVHPVLVGAYRGRKVQGRKGDLHSHASVDGGLTAVCRRVKEGNLCDLELDELPTCPECLVRIYRGV